MPFLRILRRKSTLKGCQRELTRDVDIIEPVESSIRQIINAIPLRKYVSSQHLGRDRLMVLVSDGRVSLTKNIAPKTHAYLVVECDPACNKRYRVLSSDATPYTEINGDRILLCAIFRLFSPMAASGKRPICLVYLVCYTGLLTYTCATASMKVPIPNFCHRYHRMQHCDYEFQASISRGAREYCLGPLPS
jgi:hypothetical protein